MQEERREREGFGIQRRPAEKIDIPSLDEQLQKHLDRLLFTMHKKSEPQQNKPIRVVVTAAPAAIQDWQIIPSKLVVKEVFARGTFASVHKGLYDGHQVAVKVLEWGEEGERTKAEIASLQRDFRREVSVWHKLDHPNVTKCFGATTDTSELIFQTSKKEQIGSAACVVTEYLSGGTLKSYLIKQHNKKLPLPLNIVLQLALDLARGLSYLHSNNIVHRDVKTENLLLDKSTGTLKIADFGVARLEASNSSEMTGQTGTLGYMAPEVLENKPYNRKCDVYSFGICLWEIYCCDMPYPNLGFSELTSAVVYRDLRPAIPKSCPTSLAKVMKRCWDAEPNSRPEMGEVVSMLEEIDTQPKGCFCFFRRTHETGSKKR